MGVGYELFVKGVDFGDLDFAELLPITDTLLVASRSPAPSSLYDGCVISAISSSLCELEDSSSTSTGVRARKRFC